MDRIFNLYSHCKPVKGSKRAVICDLQRNIIQPIPLILYNYLGQSGAGTYGLLPENVSQHERNAVEVFISFLYHNEFGFYSQRLIGEAYVDDFEVEDSSIITNAIVDFTLVSPHTLESIVLQLNELGCKALELRYYYSLAMSDFVRALEITAASSLEKIEVCLENSVDFKLERIISLRETYPKLTKVTLSNSSENVIYKHDDLVVITTTEIIRSEIKCGVTGELYCIAEKQLFLESQRHNNCLYKKVSVDKEGHIKNCPSMKEHYGHILDTTLASAIQRDGFQKYWDITKDSIEVCSVCELRYVCQDCRAYTIHSRNPYSKPLKCRYNPKN
jgi:SPASM domain peptide maturase of grasp-with-spasm system